MQDIPAYPAFLKIEPLMKGWSQDQKYYVETDNNEKWLLRIADIGRYDQKKREFETLRAVSKKQLPIPRPIDFGVCNNGQNVYMLLSWADGQDAGEVLPSLPLRQQYALGLSAGKILKKLHEMPAPRVLETWDARFNRKIDRKIEGYQRCGIRIDNEDKLLDYIAQNRHLLTNRPQVFQHGDYHVGNMIISPWGTLSVIDFNRMDYGDPWEEFNRIVWCADCSPAFATGRVHGYFGGKPPLPFWPLLALYIAGNTLSSICWAIPFGDAEVRTMRKQAGNILAYYNNMADLIPQWYQEDFI